jgi:lysozyme
MLLETIDEDSLVEAIKIIKRFEGCKLNTYTCPAGKTTIGWGHVITKNEYVVYKNMVFTQEMADDLLVTDVLSTATRIAPLLKYGYVSIKEFCALVSFSFNLGVESLKGSTLLKLYNKGEINKAAAQFDKWIYVNHKIIQGLINRREAEKRLFLSP